MSKIYVIGGANIDIHGMALDKLRLHDSNIGKVNFSFGGVGRNIAENLSRLGNEVVFISAFSNDPFGRQLMSDCINLHMDTSLSVIDENLATSVYLAVLDDDHDMLVGIADMDILESLNEEHLSKVIDQIDENDILIIDTNLDKNTIHFLLTGVRCIVCMDPISTVKCTKIHDLLRYITILKPNRLEAEALSGIDIVDKRSAYQALDYFLSHGVREIIITLGKDGVLASDGTDYIWFTPPVVPVQSATGAGDAFLAAYVDGRRRGKMLTDAIKQACAAANLTLRSKDAVAKNLNIKMIETLLSDCQIGEEIL